MRECGPKAKTVNGWGLSDLCSFRHISANDVLRVTPKIHSCDIRVVECLVCKIVGLLARCVDACIHAFMLFRLDRVGREEGVSRTNGWDLLNLRVSWCCSKIHSCEISRLSLWECSSSLLAPCQVRRGLHLDATQNDEIMSSSNSRRG